MGDALPNFGPVSVDVLIPVYNEAENIEHTLDALRSGIDTVNKGDAVFSIVIIYDDEGDTTIPVVQSICSGYPFRIGLHRNPNPGVLGAIKEGINASKADYLLVTMADMSDDYSCLADMIYRMKDGADVVCGSRYMSGGQTHGGSIIKKFLSWIAGISLHTLRNFPTHDITNSFKLYRRSSLVALNLESSGGFEVGMEITAKIYIRGGRIEEVPTQWWDRTEGQSHFRLWKWLPNYLRWYAMVIATERPMAMKCARQTWPVWGLLLGVLVGAWGLSWSPLDAPLTDFHAFRQTQTAISAWWMMHEGMHLAYPTPVFGAPWSIPMEFPFYQWIVVLIARFSGFSIEMIGRMVSLVCYWVSLVFLFNLLKMRMQSRLGRFYLICIVALSPIYLFWSHAFLIETLSLALCLGFLRCFQQGLQKRNVYWFAMSAVVGSLAALVKVTSLPVFYVIAGLLWLCERFRFQEKSIPQHASFLCSILVSLVVPIMAAIGWTTYSDAIKQANPLAAPFLTSSALMRWNFGTVSQRFSWEVWSRIFSHTLVLDHLWLDHVLGFSLPIIPLILGAAFILGRTRRLEILTCFGLFLINPLIFTNLHFIHSYYAVPNVLFLSLGLGYCTISLVETGRRSLNISGVAIAFLLLSALFGNYWLSYRPTQMAPPPYPPMAREIKRWVPPEAVVLIYGRDWNPTLPFASERRAIMDRWALSLGSDRFRDAVWFTGKENIQAMVIPVFAPKDFIQARCDYFHFDSKPIVTVGAEALYLRH